MPDVTLAEIQSLLGERDIKIFHLMKEVGVLILERDKLKATVETLLGEMRQEHERRLESTHHDKLVHGRPGSLEDPGSGRRNDVQDSTSESSPVHDEVQQIDPRPRGV